ncbi:hypothetical protein ABFS82_04G173100 [Erythranthe guttata]|uniref:L-tryptophan--pyruvate aminotransferase 1-like n=1 Tax=Erythranthe guttata TaxID=4155 RepID=UPI00064E0F58|nr:PREDICTED: L-tryptophan--pyruvate aminotransferase 1-like [Erythranthe guttata]|eukprot:XP_012829354.1 PREDICTED: L-tryptophan--pyruvate aminotransferase 1-like [Erythranthe guttata]
MAIIVGNPSVEGKGFIAYSLMHEKKMKMKIRIMALRHLLMFSIALNVGLLFNMYPNALAIFDFNNTSLKLPFYSAPKALDQVIDLDHGDPMVYEKYWRQMGDKTTVVIPGWKFVSYFSNKKSLCWFLEPEFAYAVDRLHKLVGNADTEDHYLVVGTGSTQLFQAVLYAASPPNQTEPISVVASPPFYSSYRLITEYLKSGLYEWAGNANEFKKDKPYVEIVTSPNNPDGLSREAVVNRKGGIVVHDLAYYWPQYTPITSAADHDIMLFTVSKCTGHAGTRLGWALVKDEEIAKKMTEFIMLSTIGVSKESQIRGAKILQVIADSHEKRDKFKKIEPFFEHSYKFMAMRWNDLEDVVDQNKLFTLPNFAPARKCNFSGHIFAPQPAFAWLKCEGEVEDCEGFLRNHKILTRGGTQFGSSAKYVRASVLSRDDVFDQFTERLSSIN